MGFKKIFSAKLFDDSDSWKKIASGVGAWEFQYGHEIKRDSLH
jgi:hypothetical protein